jgi:hypothetical protein
MSPLLRELGLRPGEPGFYQEILAAVEDGRLGQQEVTKGFVLELKEQVEVVQSRGGDRPAGSTTTVTSEKLTIKEFCHVIGIIAQPEKFKELNDVTKQFARKVWRKQELEALEESVRASPEQEQGAALVARPSRGEDPAGEDPGGATTGEEEQARYASPKSPVQLMAWHHTV